MKMLTRELKTKLTKLQEITAKGADVVDGILFKNNELIAYNLEIGVKTKIDTNSDESFIIPTKTISLINSINDDFVEIKENDNKLNINFGKTKTKHATYQVNEFAEIPDIKEKEKTQIKLSEFVNAINLTMYATSKDPNQAILNGLLVKGDGKELNFVGVDGYRLAKITVDSNASCEFIIPNRTLSFLSKLTPTGETMTIKVSSNHLQFETSEYTIFSRAISGNFVDYNKVITNDNQSVLINKNRIIETINRVTILQDSKIKSPAKMTFKEKKLIVEYLNESVNYTDEIEVESELKEEKTIGVNPKYLLECLKNIKADKVNFKISGELNPIIVENDNQLSVVLPVRIKPAT